MRAQVLGSASKMLTLRIYKNGMHPSFQASRQNIKVKKSPLWLTWRLLNSQVCLSLFKFLSQASSRLLLGKTIDF